MESSCSWALAALSYISITSQEGLRVEKSRQPDDAGQRQILSPGVQLFAALQHVVVPEARRRHKIHIRHTWRRRFGFFTLLKTTPTKQPGCTWRGRPAWSRILGHCRRTRPTAASPSRRRWPAPPLTRVQEYDITVDVEEKERNLPPNPRCSGKPSAPGPAL